MAPATKPRELLASAYLMDASRSSDDSHATPTRLAAPCDKTTRKGHLLRAVYCLVSMEVSRSSDDSHAASARSAAPCSRGDNGGARSDCALSCFGCALPDTIEEWTGLAEASEHKLNISGDDSHAMPTRLVARPGHARKNGLCGRLHRNPDGC